MKANEVLILPYKKKLNHKEYLIKTEAIDKWDNHPDHCSISFPYDESVEIDTFVKERIEEVLGIQVKFENVFNLGICQASKDSDKTYYLYCINISKYDYDFDTSQFFFASADEILENIDSQLIVAYSRLEYLRFK